MLNCSLLYKYTITNFEKSSIVMSCFVVMADQFSGLDTHVNRTRKIVHMCDLQHTCCFAHEKDWITMHKATFTSWHHSESIHIYNILAKCKHKKNLYQTLHKNRADNERKWNNENFHAAVMTYDPCGQVTTVAHKCKTQILCK